MNSTSLFYHTIPPGFNAECLVKGEDTGMDDVFKRRKTGRTDSKKHDRTHPCRCNIMC